MFRHKTDGWLDQRKGRFGESGQEHDSGSMFDGLLMDCGTGAYGG